MPLTLNDVWAIRRQREAFNGTLQDEIAILTPSDAPQWENLIGKTVDEGFRFAFSGKLYRVIEQGSGQKHTFQSYWPPDQSPSLYAPILPGQDGTEIGEWEQPDSTNTYKLGARVYHNGKLWESDYNNNSWEPGVFGWHIVEE